MLTTAEWAAKTEVVKSQIGEQKYLQATRQLSPELWELGHYITENYLN